MDISKQIQNIGESILEKFQYADSVRRKGGKFSNKDLSTLINLVESFSSLASSSKDNLLIEEASSYSYATEKLISENICHKIFEYGFFNPFDGDESAEGMNYAAMNYDEEPDDNNDIRIRRVRMWNNDTKNKIMYINGRMIAGQHFDKGDIIERCPCRLLKGSDLYSNEVRKIAFLVDLMRRIYAIPFGYGIYYRNSKQFNIDGNATYRFNTSDPNNPTIVIIATKRIRKGHEIVLESTEDDFENEVKLDQFDYSSSYNPYTSVKTIKVI